MDAQEIRDLFGTIMALVTVGATGILMLVLGVIQYRSKRPVSFYSGERRPKPEEITDVVAWNHKHGWMWIGYGLCILLSCVVAFPLQNEIVVVFIFFGGMLAPIPFMMYGHSRMKKKYWR